MDLVSGYIWIFLSQLVQTLVRVFTKLFTRYFSHEAITSACSSNLCQQNYHTDHNNSEIKTEAEIFSDYSKDAELKTESLEEATDAIQFKRDFCNQNNSNGSEPETKCDGNLGLDEEEMVRLVFKFEYQTWNCSETFDFDNSDNNKASGSINKYEYISSKSFSTFLDEPCGHPKYFPLENDSVNESERNLEPECCDKRCVDAAMKLKTVPSIEQSDECQVENLSTNVFVEETSADDNFLSEDDYICISFELDSIRSMGNGFLSDPTMELDTLRNHDEENAVLTKGDLDFECEKISESLDVGDRDIMEGIRKLGEETRTQNSDIENTELKGNFFQDRHGMNLLSSTGSDMEDFYRFDAQWEYQDLIEQLKMELNKVIATGLPTMFENSEPQRIMKELKPWEIDEKFQYGSTINELPKLHKSYLERMRKFDILNYQKLYAIGSLKTNDLMLSFSSRENSSLAITSFLPQIFHYSRRKKSESDPLKKFMREIYSDLEMAYVGQLCLSWEFLQWEYDKALQLLESDQCRLQSYHEVASEFQRFQVLLLRFIENEPFQGPRVEYYARNRGVMRNLLQVPVIREDNTNDEKKFKTRDGDKDEITSDMLVEILEESIRMIWRFIRADKDACSLIHKREIQVELQDPADSEFLMMIQTELQKKEKTLDEFLKSRNSILKKFRKNEEGGRDHILYFFSRGDMKLIWRVLNMSKITRDQLVWCHNKLNNINFVNRRIHIEPSFLLFPCQ